LLAEEEKTLQKSSKGGGSGSVRKSSDSLRGAAKVAARKEEKVEIHQEENKEVQVLAASNIDDALDLMTHVSSSAGSAGGKSGASLERHPERRAKAA
jgi:hypothetical protein